MKIDFEDLIDMTAMVDVVFFLLIFFLVTSMSPISSSIPLPSPNMEGEGARQQMASSATESEETSVVVRIDQNDVVSIEGVKLRDRQDLLFRLRELRGGSRRADSLLVQAHGDAQHGTTVMVLDSGHEAGMEHVRLAIQDEAD